MVRPHAQEVVAVVADEVAFATSSAIGSRGHRHVDPGGHSRRLSRREVGSFCKESSLSIRLQCRG